MDLSILVRGQSNAWIFDKTPAASALCREVARDLGFDGTHNRVMLLGGDGRSIWPGVSLTVPHRDHTSLAPWLTGSALSGWAVGTRERAYLAYLQSLPPKTRAAPMLTLWLHNESDTNNHALSPEGWAAAVRFDAGLVRQTLHQPAATTPYLFIWIPANFAPPNVAGPAVAATAQGIKRGMALLQADPGFHAVPAPQTGNLDMSLMQAGPGGLHMSVADALSLTHRVANCAANALAAYAQPGSPEAHRALDCQGPVADSASRAPADPAALNVHVTRYLGAPVAALSPAAAHGAGWSVRAPGQTEGTPAIAATLRNDDTITLRFARPVPAPARLYLGYGTGRIAMGDGPGQAAAIIDSLGLPMTISPDGLAVGGDIKTK